MKIILAPMGTTGDIRPFIALFKALRRQGVAPSMLVPKNAENMCVSFNIPCKTVDFDYHEMVALVEGKPSVNEMIEVLDREISAPFSALAEMAKDADFIIGSARNYAIQAISELYHIPYYQVWHTPQVFESRHITPWRFSRQNNGALLNKLLWKINHIKDNNIGRRFINKNRQAVGLKALKDFSGLYKKNILLVADKALVALPTDVKEEYLQTDYWHLLEDKALSPAIMEFINSGSRPVFLGFGSRTDSNAQKTVEMIEAVVDALKIRAIVQRGWAGLGDESTSSRILVVDEAPHHKLFPYMAAALHHGGAGTTHTALLAGIPQLIMPQNGDQFYWGELVKRCNIGPAPIPKTRLSADALKKEIDIALNSTEIAGGMRAAVEKLSRRQDMDTIALLIIDKIQSKIENDRR